MTVKWAGEACDRCIDPVSGSMVTQLTSTPFSNINIYCEQPYTSPDGNRIAMLRYLDVSFDETAKLLVGDLKKLRVALIEREVAAVFKAAWSGILHYVTAERKLCRVSLETLEKEELSVSPDPDLFGRGHSVSPDQRFLVTSKALPETMAVIVVDLQTGQQRTILDHPEMVNPHLQFNPVTGKDILVQLNRGSRRTGDGKVEDWVGEQGTTHFIIDREGGNYRALPVGPPFTAGSTGHSNFVADTGKIIASTAWNLLDWSLDPRTPEGNLAILSPEESEPQIFKAPEHRFNHVNASRCGRYFVADSLPVAKPSRKRISATWARMREKYSKGLYDEAGQIRPWCIVVGNLETGKYRTLVSNCSALGGGGQHTHPRPYLTADNRHVIFNGDSMHGSTQVFAAEVPEEFLKSLN